MALTVAQHIAELTKRFPHCNQREAEETFFYAFQKVVREHPWPFAIAEGRIVTEEEYTDGEVAVTEDGTTVTGTDTAWETSWTAAPSSRRIIIEGRSESYRVSSIASATSLTLADAWAGDTDTELAYRMYRDTYALPSNCGYGGEYILIDPEHNRAIRLKNYGSMMDRSIRQYGVTDLVTWAARVSLTATGLGQLLFDPPPSSKQVFPLLYFRGATKPSTLSALPDPLFPADAEDLIWKRMLVEYAKDPRHKRSDWRDFQNDYDESVFEAKRKYDGGVELDVRIQSTYPGLSGETFNLVLGDGNLTVEF